MPTTRDVTNAERIQAMKNKSRTQLAILAIIVIVIGIFVGKKYSIGAGIGAGILAALIGWAILFKINGGGQGGY